MMVDDGPHPGAAEAEAQPGPSPSRDCMRGQIRRALVGRIVDGTYRPGDRLIELKIAREFGTSQGPVREALRELEALRLVETRTYRGTRVRALSGRELREGAEVRGLLEAEAARLAAPSLSRPGAVAPLLAEIDALHTAAEVSAFDAYSHHNHAFHRHIVRASGNAVLLRTWDSLLLEVRTRINLARPLPDLRAVAETHRPIAEALARGDGPTAGALLREHAVSFVKADDGDAAEVLVESSPDCAPAGG